MQRTRFSAHLPVLCVAGLLQAAACGDNRHKVRPDGRTNGDIDAAPAVDYHGGTWQFQNISQSTGPLSHDGRLVRLAGGALQAAFAEPNSNDDSLQGIISATHTDGVWTAFPRTPNDEVQFAFPALVSRGDDAGLAYNGYSASTWNRVFWQTGVGATWSPPIDLTPAGGAEMDNFSATVARGEAQTVVVFRSLPIVDGQRGTPELLRLVRVPDNGAPSTPLVVATLAEDESCTGLHVAVAGDGSIHVLAACGVSGAIRYVRNTAATPDVFSATVVEGTEDCLDTALLATRDGTGLVAAWDCSDAVTVRSVSPAGEWGPARQVATGTLYTPLTLAQDANDRVLVAFHRMNSDGYGDVWLAWSDGDNGAFSLRNLTPGTDAQDDFFPSSLLVAADGGLDLVFDILRFEPLDRDVWHASWKP